MKVKKVVFMIVVLLTVAGLGKPIFYFTNSQLCINVSMNSPGIRKKSTFSSSFYFGYTNLSENVLKSALCDVISGHQRLNWYLSLGL